MDLKRNNRNAVNYRPNITKRREQIDRTLQYIGGKYNLQFRGSLEIAQHYSVLFNDVVNC